MAEEKQTCNLLFISNDMEWMHTFKRGAQRFYLIQDKSAHNLNDVQNILNEGYHPHLIILSNQEGMPTIEKLKQNLQQIRKNHPILLINSNPSETSDSYIKRGADFISNRNDLLNALRTLQHIMRLTDVEYKNAQSQKQLHEIQECYQRLFLDLPDPICYLQDGLFLNINPAFLQEFKIKEKKELDDLTIMNFVSLKSSRNVKQLMKLALEKDVVPAEQIEFATLDGEKKEFNVFVSQSTYQGEKCIQMYMRNSQGGSANSSIDESTKLPLAGVLKSSIKQTQERATQDVLGTWIYFWLENYREVLQKDGYKPAEILMNSVVETTQRMLPPSSEIARFCDDALLIWVSGDKEQTIKRFEGLIHHLDEIVPENIGRLIHPHTFAGMQEVRKDSTFEDLLAKSFRATRSLALGQSKERIAEPTAQGISRKDERRVNTIKKLLENQQIKLNYQPITSLESDGVPRYGDALEITANEDQNEEQIEVDTLLQLADRYGLGRDIDRLKINQFCQDILSYDGQDQKRITLYLNLASDSLNDPEFANWLEAQLKQTGIAPAQVICNFSLDTANNAYSGASALIKKMRPKGMRFSISEIGRFDEEVQEIFKRICPNSIKLDIREIDTFDDDEEIRFMEQIKTYANENNVEIIADNIESPAQLSRVWPYDIKLLQGEGIVSPLRGFLFNFNEPLF